MFIHHVIAYGIGLAVIACSLGADACTTCQAFTRGAVEQNPLLKGNTSQKVEIIAASFGYLGYAVAHTILSHYFNGGFILTPAVAAYFHIKAARHNNRVNR